MTPLPRPSTHDGFSLIELMIAVGIFVILTSISFIGYADFNSDITMTNQAYELSLHVRQAQVYGIAVRGDITGATPDFNSSYGVHAQAGSDIVSIFRDADDDGVFGEDESVLERLTFTRGVYVCAVCGDEACVTSGDELAITFKRPDPDARIDIDDSATTFSTARMILKAPNGKERYVDVTLTGQVSVSAPAESEGVLCTSS